MGYGKLFDDIFDSSLVAIGGWLPTYVMKAMVIKADKDGLVQIAPYALYRQLGLDHGMEGMPTVDFETFEKAIEFLESPDPESRSTDFDGKRIIPLKDIEEIDSNRGWWLVNHEFYKEKASKSEQRGNSRERMRRFRDKQKSGTGNQQLSLGCDGESDASEGHKDKDTDTDKRYMSEVFDFWTSTLKKPSQTKFTADRKDKVKARFKEGYTVDDIKKAILGCSKSSFHMGQNENGTKYDDLTLICRNGSKLEQFMAMSESTPTPPTNEPYSRAQNA